MNRRFFRAMALGALGLALAGPGMGRPVRIATPDELAALSEVVVNGMVESVELTDERRELRLGQNPPMQTRIAIAQIRTLAASKGKIGPSFTLRFATHDPDSTEAVINGPVLPWVEKGKRYRFYLKADAKGYVTVLDGEFDSGFAVEALAKEETDASPPLFKEEAEAMARSIFLKHRPGAKVNTVIGNFHAGRWTIQFFTGPPLQNPSFTYDAEIVLDGTRTIHPATWIGTEPPRQAKDFRQSDVGKRVRITVEGDFRTGVHEPRNGLISGLIGVIKSATKEEIRGMFRSTHEPESEPRWLTFPRKDLQSIQILQEDEPQP